MSGPGERPEPRQHPGDGTASREAGHEVSHEPSDTRAERGVISELLDSIEAGDEADRGAKEAAERITVGALVDRMGERSFAPVLLLPALIMVSPLSSIPGSPTVSGLIIALIAWQMLFGRDQLWLPGPLRRVSVPVPRLRQAVLFLRRPVGAIEPRLRPRLTVLARWPMSLVVLATCLAITFFMPLMEVLPLVASIAALAISLFAVGLILRDGLMILLGYAVVALAIWVARQFVG